METPKLTHRVQIVKHPITVDENGDRIEGTPEVRCTVWAEVVAFGANLTYGTEQSMDVQYRVTIRFRHIEPSDTVLWEGKELVLTKPAYDHDGTHRWATLQCKEVIEDAREKA